MAENAHAADSAAPRPVHPFFAQNRACTSVSIEPAQSDAQALDGTAVLPPNTPAETKTSHDDATQNTDSCRSRRRKADQEPKEEDTQKRTRPTKRTKNMTSGGDIGHLFLKLSNGVEGEKQLRQGNSSANPSGQDEVSHETNNVTPDDRGGPTNDPDMKPPQIADPSKALITGCVPEPTESPRAAEGTPTKPRKMLHFNPKTGTIGSPPKPKEPRPDAKEAHEIEKMVGRRGRKPASKIVRIVYGTDPNVRVNLGKLIDGILGGKTRHLFTGHKKTNSLNIKQDSPKAGDETPTAKPSKATHPFFLGRTKATNSVATDPKPKKPDPSSSSNTMHYCSTPCSPRKSRAVSASKVPMPQFGIRNLGLKFPGAKLPAWPWQGMVHVRGDVDELPGLENKPMLVPFRKSKGNAIKMMPRESVISILADSMELPLVAETVRTVNTDEFIPPPPELRLPQKHFESGSKLQSRVLSQLKTFQPSLANRASASETASIRGNHGSVGAPPQLARLFSRISSSLSAFDMSQYETANWVQKYAPTNATEVLQPEREIFFLRDWLQALMVQSVDTGSGESDKPKTGQKTKSSDAGRRKRRKKLDGFIVSSEDEGHEWYDLSEGEDDWAPSGFRGIVRKTVMRSSNRLKGRDGDKTANTLVISGPQGCGKTAAVYAVAKELDFEVFEINASSRRSGKDVLEKIGDMTRNHHVQQHHSSEAPNNEDTAADDDDVAKDIKSGKQSTMKAFFETKTKGSKSRQPAKSQNKGLEAEVKKEPSKSQRQSLILLEEVDILYEEDKQFWTTLVGLIAQAKRPFIMTCNDETLIPLHTLTLHGIFRLSTPPKDLAVDRLLLIAANEGHALTRESVEQLYDSRGGDLRAATMDLQFWCQIGVGDRKGGLDWFYPRWPMGVDLDENKEVVRVVSQDTYRLGMNLLGRDPITDSKIPPRLVEEEVLRQTWESWGLDVGHWQDSPEFACWAESLAPASMTPAGRLPALEAYDDLASAISVADVCSSKSFAAFKEEPMDTTQPEQPAKIREDFVLGITHLDSPVITHYSGLPTSIACTIKSLAKSSLSLHAGTLGQQAAAILRPLDETQAIRYLQKSFTSTLPGTAVIDRMDFAFAFDPIAAPDTSPLQPVSYLEPSVFDRTIKLITLDVAPYVRSIVAYESHLQRQRAKLSTLVSEGGKGANSSKRMRTTRAALSALEGGSRSTTRAERWFKADINPYLVAKTAGKDWNGFGTRDPEPPNGSTKGSMHNSLRTSPDTTPTKTSKKAGLKSRKRKNVLGDGDDDDDDADGLGCPPGDVSG
ncbi:P-loop containing nucleoside triphosphate hydrolase protein [Thermothelomyces heterothallicus CBS 203.75]